eukprot:m.355253 g.355253  ORF g.355253 m.355253 type:complete len:77 (-) comp17206_c0_seq1:1678-1908(-)
MCDRDGNETELKTGEHQRLWQAQLESPTKTSISTSIKKRVNENKRGCRHRTQHRSKCTTNTEVHHTERVCQVLDPS